MNPFSDYDHYFDNIPQNNIIFDKERPRLLTIINLSSHKLRSLVGLVDFSQYSIQRQGNLLWQITIPLNKEQQDYFMRNRKEVN